MDVKGIIKKRRIEMQLTLKDVAEKVGVNEGTVSRWESGEIENMRRDKIVALAKALEISPAVIMGWDDSIPPYPNIHPVTTRRFPVLGSVSCGEPKFMDEEIDVYVDASEEIKADFVLRAKGDSMIGARIYDGDLVFVRKQDIVENGEIAVVAIDDEATMVEAEEALKKDYPYFGYGYFKDVKEAIPNVPIIFYAFHLMVMIGGFLLIYLIATMYMAYKRKEWLCFRWNNIAIFPIIFGAITKMNIAMGGTSILIVVSVALETSRTMESQMMMRHHKGFLE